METTETPANTSTEQATGDQSSSDSIPEKFKGKSAEEIAQAYVELERKFSKQNSSQSDENTPEGQQDTQQSSEATQQSSEAQQQVAQQEAAVQSQLENTGFDYSAVKQEFIDNNFELTQETRDKLVERFGEDMVNDYLANTQKAVEATRQEWFQRVGGEGQWQKMQEFAQSNWTDDQIEAFNEAMKSGSQAKIDMALNTLTQDFQKKNGSPSRLMNPSQTSAGSNTLDRFNSRAEVTQAMRDKRYKTDPAYRAEVDRKLANSDILDS